MSVTLNEGACDQSPHCMMVSMCPTGAITQRSGGYPAVNEELCVDCGQCVSACPHQALSFT